MTQETITVEVLVKAPLNKVWECWNGVNDIPHWAFASDDWAAPEAENDLRVGGKFKTIMEAKDKSARFDFGGTYTVLENNKRIEYDMGDSGRHVKVEFKETPDGTHVTETFDPENENPIDKQRAGWQAILKNFKKYVESK